jgi:hypothetical protein
MLTDIMIDIIILATGNSLFYSVLELSRLRLCDLKKLRSLDRQVFHQLYYS